MVFSLSGQPMSTEFIADEVFLRRLTPSRERTTHNFLPSLDSGRIKEQFADILANLWNRFLIILKRKHDITPYWSTDKQKSQIFSDPKLLKPILYYKYWFVVYPEFQHYGKSIIKSGTHKPEKQAQKAFLYLRSIVAISNQERWNLFLGMDEWKAVGDKVKREWSTAAKRSYEFFQLSHL